MNTIDFSPKHDVLIRNDDGSLVPMDEPFFQSEPVAPGVWKVLSSGDFHYLVEGENEALAIDTGYGAGNLREYLQTLTDKPVRCAANTHYHFDHTASNPYFDGVYMTEVSVPLATIPYKSFEPIQFPTDYPRLIIKEGDVIDLGGRKLEVIEIGGHARGSVAYLDRANRIMFTGDEVNRFVVLNRSIAGYAAALEKLVALRDEYDVCFGGHGAVDPDTISKLLSLCRDVLEGKIDIDAPGGPKGGPKGGPGGPKGGQDAPEGVTVYGRQSPRPGDGGGDVDRENRRMAAGNEVRISFNRKNIFENGADLY